MICASCGHNNDAEARFCVECGADLTAACPACGHHIEADYMFCPNCGNDLRPDASAAPAPETYTPPHLAKRILAAREDVVGERKQVTVLFADIVGSTSLVEGRDPEEAAQFLGAAVGAMIEAVHRYEGTVAKALGDGIMALFGAPLAVEDHAVRASLAALAMSDHVAAVTDAQVRVGLDSGEVLVKSVGNDLSVDYDALGPTVHLASRMEGIAEPGSPRMTAKTFRLVEGFMETRSLGAVDVKGISHPVDVFALDGTTHHSTQWEARAARGLTEFAGRESEMAVLHHAREGAAAGFGQVVAIVGEAGVGKSRLSHEFLSPGDGFLVLECGASPYDIATPHYPFKVLLRAWLGVEGDEVDRDKLHERLDAVDPDLRSALPALASLLDVGDVGREWEVADPAARRRAIRDAIKGLLLAAAHAEPVALLVEDLHWADGESLAVLDEIVDAVGAAPVLLILTYRPTLVHDWSAHGYMAVLPLEPLAGGEADLFLDGLLGDDPSVDPLKPILLDRAEGTPLFLEESVRDLAEAGRLVGERGAYLVVDRIDEVDIPDSVQAVVSARIDRLAPELKDTLQTAAVVGETIPFGLLAGIGSQGKGDLAERLGRLQNRDLMYQTRVFPAREYSFKHNLTREAAYAGLAMARRRELHGQLVDLIKSDADRIGENIERLAYHAIQAERWEEAARFAGMAGKKALDQSAYNDAGRFLRAAARAFGNLPPSTENTKDAIDARLQLRVVATGGAVTFSEAAAALDEAERMAAGIDDTERLYQVGLNRSWIAGMTGSFEEAVSIAREVLAIAERLDDRYYRAEARLAMAQAYTYAGIPRAAIDNLEGDVDFLTGPLRFEQRGHAATRSVVSLGHLGVSRIMVGNLEGGEKAHAEARKIVAVHRRPFDLAFLGWADGFGHYLKGDAREAARLFDGVAEVSADHDILFFSAWVAPVRAGAHALMGDTEQARVLLEAARAWSIRTEISYLLGWVDVYSTQVLAELGQTEEAREAGGRALAAAVRDGSVLMEVMARSALSPLSSATEAREHLATAVDLAERYELVLIVESCREQLAALEP